MTNLNRNIPLIVLFFASFSVYLNALGNNFVSDDVSMITYAQQHGGLWVLSGIPLRSYLLAMIYALFNANPLPFRLANILLHAITTVCLYEIVSRLINRKVGFFSALLFTVHPIATESVTWISGGAYPQYGAFLLGSFLMYIESTNRPRRYWYALVLYIGALLSSEKAALYPLILLSYEWFYGNIKMRWRLILSFCFVTLLVIPLRLLQISNRSGLAEGFSAWALSGRDPFRHIAATTGIYIDTILWPVRLSAYHSAIGTHLLTYIRWYGITIGLCLSLLFSAIRKKKVGFWISFFFIATLFAIAPTILVSSYAERYVYLGSAGIITLVVYAILTEAEILHISLFAFVLLGFLTIALGIRTTMRNTDWFNERSFVFATLRDSQNNPKAHNMAASIYARENKLAEARQELEQALSLSPTYYPGYFNLALLSEQEGRTREAMFFYQKTLELNPSEWEAHKNLGVLYRKNQNYEAAREHFQQAIKINSQNPSLYIALGQVFLLMGDKNNGIQAFQKVLLLEPTNREAQNELKMLTQ